MIDPTDVYALTDFQRNAKSHIRRLKKTGRPEVLTINGKAAVVIQNAKTYQRMMAAAERAAEIHAVLEGLEQAEAGVTQPLEEADRELRARFAKRRKTRRKTDAPILRC